MSNTTTSHSTVNNGSNLRACERLVRNYVDYGNYGDFNHSFFVEQHGVALDSGYDADVFGLMLDGYKYRKEPRPSENEVTKTV